MKKIIRLTESDLTKIVKRVLREQKAAPEQDYVGGINIGGGKTIGGIPTKDPSKQKPSNSNLGCVSPDDYKIKGAAGNSFKYNRPDGEYIFYDDGRVWKYDLNTTKRTNTGTWTCGSNQLEVRWDNDPKAVNYQPLPKKSFGKNLGGGNCAAELTDIFSGKFVFMGCNGNAVKEIQKMLKLDSDGIFGSETKEAVKKFQVSKGIKPDGVVGRDTLSFLQKS